MKGFDLAHGEGATARLLLLLKEGKPYSIVAEAFGITRQRVGQLVAELKKSGYLSEDFAASVIQSRLKVYTISPRLAEVISRLDALGVVAKPKYIRRVPSSRVLLAGGRSIFVSATERPQCTNGYGEYFAPRFFRPSSLPRHDFYVVSTPRGWFCFAAAEVGTGYIYIPVRGDFGRWAGCHEAWSKISIALM